MIGFRAFGVLASSLVVCAVLARPVHAAIPEWVTQAAEAKPVAKGADAVVLLDDTLMTITADGSITTRHRSVLKILTAAGRDYGYPSVPFDRDTRIVSFRGWSIAANGTQYSVKERDAAEVTPYSGLLYSDERMMVLRIPAADAGSVVAFEYEQRERPYMLQALWQFQRELPVVVSSFRIVLAPGWSYDARWSRHAGVEPSVAEGGPVWTLRDIPAIADEPKMPATMALAGRVAVRFIPPSSPRGPQDWNGIAAWFASLASSRGAPTPSLQSKVRELTKGMPPLDAIRAVARFAQRDVRYVAIEIGIGGYQPHPAGEIFTNRYGDCKDKATLLRTMLREIGVESHYVLVNSTRGVVDPALPTMYAFDHVILAIRLPETTDASGALLDHPRAGRLLLFDPTSTTTPFGELPPSLQASSGLLVLGDGGELIAMPAHSAEASQLRRTAKLQLSIEGTLTGQVEEIRTGHIASAMRGALQSMTGSERQRFIESSLSFHLARFAAGDLVLENVDEPESDLVVRYSITAQSYAARVGDMLLVRPRVLGQKPESQVSLAERRYGYVTEGPSLQTDTIEIALPPSLQLDELPAPVTVSTPSVQYASKSELTAGVLRYQRRYALLTFFVPLESLPELNRSFAQILADERASAIFK
jgi:hypothetical protein